MKPLFVLLITCIISLIALKLCMGNWNFILSGNIAMSVMLMFTAIGHFAYTKGMEMMLPAFVPFKTFMVYITGIIEVVAAIGLLIPSLQLSISYVLIVFFILVLPCNIYAAVKKVDYQKGTYTGRGTSYLWLRVPMQILFIAWVYFCNCY